MAHFETSDGHQLYYKTRGDSDAPAIVFLNGMTQSTQHWSSQAKAFGEDYFVITYDARGQGGSDLGDEELSLELHADDLRDLLDHLDVDQPHLVGFSHGARIALEFAIRHTERLDQLVLTSLSAEPTALARTIVRSWYGVLQEGGLEAMVWSALPNILGNDYLEQTEEILEGVVRASVRRNSEDGTRALLEGLMNYPPMSELAGEVEAPTLVLSASEDLLVEREGAEKLAELTDGDHVEVDGVGHTIPIEAPKVFREHILDFIG